MSGTLAEHWEALTVVGMLGTDRHPLPAPPAGIAADLAARRGTPDVAVGALDQIALLTAAQRGGLRPEPAAEPLPVLDGDPRPVCPTPAIALLAEILTRHPELVEEWLLEAEANGWRLPPDLVPPLLTRWQGDHRRRELVAGLAGPLAGWLGTVFPGRFRPTRSTAGGTADHHRELPEDLARLLGGTARAAGEEIAGRLEVGALGQRHRALLVEFLCRVPREWLGPIADRLRTAWPRPDPYHLADDLAEFAGLRTQIAEELHRG